MKKLDYIYCDFETTNVKIPKTYKTPLQYYAKEKDAKYPVVYSWNILWDKGVSLGINQNKETDECSVKYGIEQDSKNNFINEIKNIDKDVIAYFNNLRGFDGHYLINMLDQAGFKYIPPYDLNKLTELPEHIFNTYTERIIDIKHYLLKNNPYINSTYTNLKLEDKQKAREFISKQIAKQWNLLLENEYSTLTDGNTNIYEIKVGLASTKKTGKVKRNRALIFRDNLYLFPSSIQAMGKSLIKTYSVLEPERKDYWIEKFSKKELKAKDGSAYNRTERYKNIKELEDDGNELDYLIQDTYILWKFHKEMEKFIPRKTWKMTIGSLAYKELIQSSGEKLLNIYINAGKISSVKLERGAIRYVYKGKKYTTSGMKQHLMYKMLPTKWLDKTYKDEITYYELIQLYYNAGLVRVNEDYRGSVIKNITFIDIHSSYPSIMGSLDKFVPYGQAYKGDGGKEYPFKFYKITPLRNIKNEKGLPFMFNRLAESREYQRVLRAGTEYRITSIKFERFLKYYKCNKKDFKIEIELSFKQIPIGVLFGDYVEKNYNIKSTTLNDILKNATKLKLNSPYGKFATKLIREFMIWNQEDGNWYKDYKVGKSKYYLPLAIAITEHAQMKLVDGIGENHDKFVYCDTDSLAIKDFKQEDFPDIELHESKLGAWGIDFKGDGIFRRTKQYMLRNKDGDTKVAFAGINLNRFELGDDGKELDDEIEQYKKVSFKDFLLGKTISNQNRGYKLLSSVVLIKPINKTIKPVWDFPPLPEQTKHLPKHFEKDILDATELDKFYHNII